MSALTPIDIEAEYKKNKYNELSMSANIKKSTGIIERDIYMSSGGKAWPVKLLSVSMTGAMISIRLSENDLAHLSANGNVRIHYSFVGMKPYLIPTAFLTEYSISDITSSPGSRDSMVLNLTAVKRPEYYLIRVIAEVLDMQSLSTKRSDVRITINGNTAEQLGLKSIHCILHAKASRTECSLHDISLSGCQIIMKHTNIQVGDKISLDILILEPDAVLEISGRIMRIAGMGGAGEQLVAGIKYEEGKIPPEYFSRMQKLIN